MTIKHLLYLILFCLGCLSFSSCCKDKKDMYLEVDETKFIFDVEGDPQYLNISSNTKWFITDVDGSASWCNISPMQGDGDAVVTLLPDPYTERVPRLNGLLEVNYPEGVVEIEVHQYIYNRAPEIPRILSPADGITLPDIYPHFKWSVCEDPDDDPVFYGILISEDQEDWTPLSFNIDSTNFLVDTKILVGETTYYWKVYARDEFGGSTESEIRSFVTGEYEFYEDGEVRQITESKFNELNPVKLVILGDGYLIDDFEKNGLFDRDVERAVEAFFSVEPYPTYRDYFSVYKIAVYSEESGATVLNDFVDSDVTEQVRNTAFSAIFEGDKSATVRCNRDKVLEYVQHIPEITEEELTNTTILLMINLDVYAGSTAVYEDGTSIAMIPVHETDFDVLVYHEAAGHGFGRLVDEYIDYPDEAISEDIKQYVEENYRVPSEWHFGGNISFTDDPEKIHWRHFFDKEGYENVGIIEGGFYYAEGVWRSEETSCMLDNSPYYNAPSREAIVRRIKQISGEPFDLDDFFAKDKKQQVRKSHAAFASNRIYKRTAPPVLIKKQN